MQFTRYGNDATRLRHRELMLNPGRGEKGSEKTSMGHYLRNACGKRNWAVWVYAQSARSDEIRHEKLTGRGKHSQRSESDFHRED